MPKPSVAALLAPLLLAACTAASPETPPMSSTVPDTLLTVAERSDYRATARHAEVVALVDALVASSPLARRGSLGLTFEGRDIPWMTIADPPVETPEEARASGKLVVFAFANIHAGEVCGKEALPVLARDILLDPQQPRHAALLSELVLVLVPIYNGDGNERISTTSRPNQDGPAEGQGERPNAQGLDLNRDCMKLESPEGRAMARFLTAWRPHLVLDLHTTNGSFHRYLLTYAPPLNPEGHPAPLAFVRDRMLPEVSERLLARTGYDTFLYGNFEERDGDRHGAWATYSAQPRFGAQNHGLRGHASILSEAYSHATYRERVLATLEFVRECLDHAVEHADTLREAVETGWIETAAAVPRARGDGQLEAVDVSLTPVVAAHLATVGLRHTIAAAPEPAVIHGWVETVDADGRVRPTDEPRDYTVRHLDRFEPTVEVRRPLAYLVPPGFDAVLETLATHGLETEPWTGEVELPVEVARVDAVDRAETAFQGHHEVRLEVSTRRERRAPGPGWTVVPVAQPLGTLAVYLLEPLSDDGLVTWNALDAHLAVGEDYPILRWVAE